MKTVLAPNAPWPKVEPATEQPKKKKKWVSVADPNGKRANTDKKFAEWLAKGQA